MLEWLVWLNHFLYITLCIIWMKTANTYYKSNLYHAALEHLTNLENLCSLLIIDLVSVAAIKTTCVVWSTIYLQACFASTSLFVFVNVYNKNKVQCQVNLYSLTRIWMIIFIFLVCFKQIALSPLLTHPSFADHAVTMTSNEQTPWNQQNSIKTGVQHFSFFKCFHQKTKIKIIDFSEEHYNSSLKPISQYSISLYNYILQN